MKAENLLMKLGDIRDEYILEALERPARRPALPVRKLLLAGVSAAVASFQSDLLGYIYRNATRPPTPEAESHLVQLDGQPETKDGFSFRVDEYLLDDDRLYLTWTAENHTGEPLIFLGPYIAAKERDITLRAGDQGTLVGGEIQGVALPEIRGVTTEYAAEACLDGALPATVTMFALSPKAAFVDVATSSPAGTPVIVWEPRSQEIDDYCYGYSFTPVEDDAWGYGTAAYNHDDFEALWDGDYGDSRDMQTDVDALTALGYVEPLDRIDVELTIARGARRRLLIQDYPSFEFEDYTVTVTELSQTDLTTRLRFQAIPKPGRAEALSEWLFYKVRLNDADAPPRDISGSRSTLNDGGFLFDDVAPLDDTPGILAFEYEWLNDGEAMKRIRLAPENAPEEAIDWII